MNLFRWSHAHSFAGGLVAGLVILTHGPYLALAFLVVFLIGVVVGRVWHQARRTVLETTSRIRELHAAKVATEQAKTVELLTRTEHRARPRKLQDAEVDRAYVRGATDALSR